MTGQTIEKKECRRPVLARLRDRLFRGRVLGYRCVPVCDGGLLGDRFRAFSAALSAAALVEVSTAGMAEGLSFSGLAKASLPGGFGNACPGLAVVRRIRLSTNLYRSEERRVG